MEGLSYGPLTQAIGALGKHWLRVTPQESNQVAVDTPHLGLLLWLLPACQELHHLPPPPSQGFLSEPEEQWRTKMAPRRTEWVPAAWPIHTFLTEKLQLWNLAGGWRGGKEHQVIRTIKDHHPTSPPHRGPQESQQSSRPAYRTQASPET